MRIRLVPQMFTHPKDVPFHQILTLIATSHEELGVKITATGWVSGFHSARVKTVSGYFRPALQPGYVYEPKI
jgi:hypothetical protein